MYHRAQECYLNYFWCERNIVRQLYVGSAKFNSIDKMIVSRTCMDRILYDIKLCVIHD